MAFYGGSGRGGRDSIDIDFDRLFGRGGQPPINIQTPSWLGKVFGFGLGIVVLIILLSIADGIYTDLLWFGSLGYSSVYVTRITAQIYTFIGFGALFVVLLTGNIWLARGMRRRSPVSVADGAPEIPRVLVRIGWGLAIGVQALIMASVAGGFWESLLSFKNATSFGIKDALLRRDVGFYIFKLPVYRELQVWLLWALILTLANVGIAYGLGSDFARLRSSRAAAIHLSIIGAGLFALIAWNYQLDIYGLLFSHRGVTQGASYTDVHAQFGAYQVLVVVTGLAAIAFIANAFIRRLWLLVTPIVTWLVVLIIAGGVIPTFVQQFQVKPNELNLERPYIANNIQATRHAFNLDKVAVQNFAAANQVTPQQIATDQVTTKNIRLLDYRPLQTTYNQIQSFRQYYDFPSIEVDRYRINGVYQQVMLGGRELDTSHLSAQAQTWVNLHLQYTHGYGVAMSPVSDVTSEGLPNFIEQNIPPEGPLKVTQPQIYYGAQTSNWVIVDTQQQEFDYPKGDQNVFSSYGGSTGVKLDSVLKKLAFAWRFGDLNIMISDALTSKSQILFNRVISQRVQQIAPFLVYDRDPYLVVDNGHLYWIQDAYTTSNNYPYSQSFDTASGTPINYIRNSVKIVVDAYNGTTNFYVADPTDPLIQTYQKIFPSLFHPLSAMPATLRAHIRYPEDMFLAQMDMYLTYHMTDPQVFYNREDLWALPEERFSQTTGTTAGAQQIQPYYVLMRLPGQSQDEFLLLMPFTPSGKSNMISWVVARSDGANYGKLLDYKLTKDRTVYGPLQVESQIDQDPAISSQLSLWNQQGSHVIRGNLLVIPIGQSFLYVEPLYLQAQSNPLPELKRVIVANGNVIAMANTLKDALTQVFTTTPTQPGAIVSTLPPATVQPSAAASPSSSAAGTPAPAATPTAASAAPAPALQPLAGVPPKIASLAQDANTHYDRAQTALRSGDFATYGKEMQAVQADLQQLGQLTGASH